jgi:hypothetical protein
MMQASIASMDSTIKPLPAVLDSNTPPKQKVQAKVVKSKPKTNNKHKNNSLIKKNKTARALMPKKSKSPTTKN